MNSIQVLESASFIIITTRGLHTSARGTFQREGGHQSNSLDLRANLFRASLALYGVRIEVGRVVFAVES